MMKLRGRRLGVSETAMSRAPRTIPGPERFISKNGLMNGPKVCLSVSRTVVTLPGSFVTSCGERLRRRGRRSDVFR